MLKERVMSKFEDKGLSRKATIIPLVMGEMKSARIDLSVIDCKDSHD